MPAVLRLAGLLFLLPATIQAQTPELVFLSNITATSRDGGPLTTVGEQTTAALDALGEQLRARGIGYGNVVAMNVFLRDSRHFAAMNGVYRGYFAESPPTRATVEADLTDRDALVQISAVATPDETEVIAPAGLQSPALPYSWGMRAGDVLFIAGATSRDPETYQPVRGDVQTQTRRVFGNIGMVLEEAGMGFGDLVACKVFLDDVRLWGDMNEAYREFVTADDPPARAAVRGGLMGRLDRGTKPTPVGEGVRSRYRAGIDRGDDFAMAQAACRNRSRAIARWRIVWSHRPRYRRVDRARGVGSASRLGAWRDDGARRDDLGPDRRYATRPVRRHKPDSRGADPVLTTAKRSSSVTPGRSGSPCGVRVPR